MRFQFGVFATVLDDAGRALLVHRIRDALRDEPRTLLKVAEGPSWRDVAHGKVIPS